MAGRSRRLRGAKPRAYYLPALIAGAAIDYSVIKRDTAGEHAERPDATEIGDRN
jgi:hypothetical protein